MSESEGFYTIKGYERKENLLLTNAMEDYLEMICRLQLENRPIRISVLAQLLHVRPPSCSKMVQQLAQLGYLQAPRYGFIAMTTRGKAAGEYFLYRHGVIHQFLCLLNHTKDELEQTEKMEHFVEKRTVEQLERLCQSGVL